MSDDVCLCLSVLVVYPDYLEEPEDTVEKELSTEVFWYRKHLKVEAQVSGWQGGRDERLQVKGNCVWDKLY